MGFILKGKLLFMTQLERQNPPAISKFGSGQPLCGNYNLANLHKQVIFHQNTIVKWLVIEGNRSQFVWANPDFYSNKQVAGIAAGVVCLGASGDT